MNLVLGLLITLGVAATAIAAMLLVFVYLIANNDGMTERSQKDYAAQQAATDDYIRSVAGGSGAAAEIERAKGLLDSGAITQAEFDAIKAKALAA